MIFRGQQVIIPRGSDVLAEGDHVYVVATRRNLGEVTSFMGSRRRAGSSAPSSSVASRSAS